MLVFGDRSRTCAPREVTDALAVELATLGGQPAGLERHARLVGAFLLASELAQGLGDRAHPECDGRDRAADAAMRLAVELAAAIDASWRAGFARRALGVASVVLDATAALAGDAPIGLRHAEGYAFYAVYPEAYLAAARRAAPPDRVIGLRSIGAGLAALVAAATGAPLPATVRPRGAPFSRTLSVAPALAAEWRNGTRFAIADEGPGLSGSSFGAVLDALEREGVALDHIACFPSHGGGLGPAASPAHRARWDRVARHVVDVDELLLRGGHLARWIAALVGDELEAPLEDVSAGRWRRGDEAAWPPAIRAQERRKLVARTRRGAWLARFAGLGRDGDHALALARRLHRAGFTPEPGGLCHGFLIERWVEATPLPAARLDADLRRHLIDHVGRYLGFRARALPAGHGRGAGLRELEAMLSRNTSLGLGAALTARGSASALEVRVRPVEVDGALHLHEWLLRPDGALIKADAVDHHAAHDLVGCQDIAWDVAGAIAELELSAAEQARLIAVVGAEAGRAVDPELLAFYGPCYLAFQLGRHALAADGDPDEAPRLRAAVQRYAELLARGPWA